MSTNDLPPPPPSDPFGRPIPTRAVDGIPVATRAAAAAKLKVPAILLIVFGSIGALLSVVSIVFSAIMTPERMQKMMQEMVPNAPPNAFAGAGGSTAINIASGVLFLLLNVFLIFGSVQAMRVRTYPVAFAAAIAGMVNVGNCCCLLTLPIGIWLLVILLQPDVKKAFDAP